MVIVILVSAIIAYAIDNTVITITYEDRGTSTNYIYGKLNWKDEICYATQEGRRVTCGEVCEEHKCKVSMISKKKMDKITKELMGSFRK